LGKTEEYKKGLTGQIERWIRKLWGEVYFGWKKEVGSWRFWSTKRE